MVYIYFIHLDSIILTSIKFKYQFKPIISYMYFIHNIIIICLKICAQIYLYMYIMKIARQLYRNIYSR